MNPYNVLQINQNYENLNEFNSEENDKKIKESYISIKNFYENEIKEYTEKYKLSDDDIIGENYSEKVERAFGKIDKENNFEEFNSYVDEIENAEEKIQNAREKLKEIEEAYEKIKSPAQRIIEYTEQTKSKKSNNISSESVKFMSNDQTFEFRKMIFDELGFTTLAKGNNKSVFAKIKEYFASRNKLKTLTQEERKMLKEYIKTCFERKTEMDTMELLNMPDGINAYITPSDLDIEYSVIPGNLTDSFGVYDLTIVNQDCKEVTTRIFTEKNSVLQKMLKNPICAEKLSKTIFSLENIQYAIRENNGFLGIPVMNQAISEESINDQAYLGFQWDPYMYKAVEKYIEKQRTYEHEEKKQEENER